MTHLHPHPAHNVLGFQQLYRTQACGEQTALPWRGAELVPFGWDGCPGGHPMLPTRHQNTSPCLQCLSWPRHSACVCRPILNVKSHTHKNSIILLFFNPSSPGSTPSASCASAQLLSSCRMQLPGTFPCALLLLLSWLVHAWRGQSRSAAAFLPLRAQLPP